MSLWSRGPTALPTSPSSAAPHAFGGKPDTRREVSTLWDGENGLQGQRGDDDGLEVALVILAGGWVAGGAHDRLRKMRAERKEARERAVAGPEPICGCWHHLAYHDPRELPNPEREDSA